jgi:hypothetical protein
VPPAHAASTREVRHLLADPAAADQMGGAGRRDTEENHDIQSIVDAILKPVQGGEHV